MIKCNQCKREGVITDAEEIFAGIPLCQKHYNEKVNKTYICPECGKEVRPFNEFGDYIDGHFATMHDICYEKQYNR